MTYLFHSHSTSWRLITFSNSTLGHVEHVNQWGIFHIQNRMTGFSLCLECFSFNTMDGCLLDILQPKALTTLLFTRTLVPPVSWLWWTNMSCPGLSQTRVLQWIYCSCLSLIIPYHKAVYLMRDIVHYCNLSITSKIWPIVFTGYVLARTCMNKKVVCLTSSKGLVHSKQKHKDLVLSLWEGCISDARLYNYEK